MTGWERIMRTLEFKNPDRVPVDLWVLPAAKSKYGEKLELLEAGLVCLNECSIFTLMKCN